MHFNINAYMEMNSMQKHMSLGYDSSFPHIHFLLYYVPYIVHIYAEQNKTG